MAPTIKWQRWDSASYDWHSGTADGAVAQIEAELDAWIAAVNAHTANTGRQITKMRGYADSTGGSYAGITLRYGANSNTEYAYSYYGTRGSTSSRTWYIGPNFADDTSNGGYGTVSGGASDSSISWRVSGYEADFLLIYDTTEGQEYFLMGPRFGTSTSYMDGFAIMKSTTGEWMISSGDGSATRYTYHYFNDSVSTGWSAINRTATGNGNAETRNNALCRYHENASTSGSPSSFFSSNISVAAASPDLLAVSSSGAYYQTGTRRVITDISPNNDFYLLSSYYYGPVVIVDLRP